MKIKFRFVVLAAAFLTAGVAHAGFDEMFGAVKDVAKAVSVSDKDIIEASRQMMVYKDKHSRVAPPGSKYAQRLAALTAKHTKEDGLKLNFKVYLSSEVNAFATADGSVRVESGLLDAMTDDEVRGVIGHEIGHTKLGHSAARMRTAYLASAARKAAANSNGALGAIADSDLGSMFEAIANAQFSQANETASDDYGFEFMKKHKYNVSGMESAFRKLAKMEGSGGHSVMSSHPDSAARADRMKQKAEGKQG